jgi:hypothetical protein
MKKANEAIALNSALVEDWLGKPFLMDIVKDVLCATVVETFFPPILIKTPASQ